MSLARRLGLVGLVDGQQLQSRDAECLEVGGHHADALVGAEVLLGNVHHVLEARLPAEQRAEADDRRMPDELGHRGLVDGGLLPWQLRLGECRAGGTQDDALGGDAARVDLSPRHPPVVVTAGPEGPAVEASLQDRVGVDVVGDLQGVGVEEHLVGVEAVAALVDVGDEADGAAGHPDGIPGPVWAPGPEAVEVELEDSADMGAPHPVGSLRHRIGGGGVGAEGIGEELKLHPGGVGGVHRKGGTVLGEMRTERPLGAPPDLRLHRSHTGNIHVRHHYTGQRQIPLARANLARSSQGVGPHYGRSPTTSTTEIILQDPADRDQGTRSAQAPSLT